MHEGVDIGAEPGTPIVAVNDALVAYSDNRMNGYGNALLLVHADGSVSLYAHCRATYVAAGEMVHRGQVIAEVGDTGLAHGPHLHFEWHVRGRSRDPFRRFVGREQLVVLDPTRELEEQGDRLEASAQRLEASEDLDSAPAAAPVLASVEGASRVGPASAASAAGEQLQTEDPEARSLDDLLAAAIHRPSGADSDVGEASSEPPAGSSSPASAGSPSPARATAETASTAAASPSSRGGGEGSIERPIRRRSRPRWDGPFATITPSPR